MRKQTRRHPLVSGERWPRLFAALAVLLVGGLPALVFSASESDVSLEVLLGEICSEIQPDQAMEFMRRVYSTDRWFTFPKFQETAEYLRRSMLDIGLQDVQILGAPADGVSQFGYWTMPLAWEVREARLEIVDPEVPTQSRVLADYRKVPTSLGMWSGPTPPGGTTAEVVELKPTRAEEIAKLDLHGKLALTRENPAEIKWALVKAGALGAINTFTENPHLQDGRQWINAWGDSGWGFTKGSTPLLCFSITPRESAFIRKLLAERGAVRVKATVDSRYYRGVYPYVTGIIPGTGPEEVLTLGHTSEQGAEDNATGVAAMLEALATVNRLIAAGKLAKPKRSIRILTMGELYGSMHYIATHPERIHATVAAMCLDTPAASYDLAGTEYTFYMNPHVSKSYADAFVLRVAEDYFSKLNRPWHWHEFMSGTDSYLGEPTIGVPTVWAYSGSGVQTHHNSEDTPDRVDPRSLRDISSVDAAYLYFLANAGEAQALWLAELSQTRGHEQILLSSVTFLDRIENAKDGQQLGQLLAPALDKITYSVDRESQAVYSVLRLVPESRRDFVRTSIAPMAEQLRRFGEEQSARVRYAAQRRARRLGITSPVAPIPAPHAQAALASTIVVKRKRFGTIPLDDLPPDQREGYPSGAWAMVPITALYWCDRNRSLAEVIHLTRMELGPTDFDFVGYFRFLEKHGYVEFLKK